ADIEGVLWFAILEDLPIKLTEATMHAGQKFGEGWLVAHRHWFSLQGTPAANGDRTYVILPAVVMLNVNSMLRVITTPIVFNAANKNALIVARGHARLILARARSLHTQTARAAAGARGAPWFQRTGRSANGPEDGPAHADGAYRDDNWRSHNADRGARLGRGRKMYALMGVSPMEAAARIKKQLIDTI
ncbi:hypothetical protein T492DRAFT_887991, partial [Pavlovales sp. CCMP2436]